MRTATMSARHSARCCRIMRDQRTLELELFIVFHCSKLLVIEDDQAHPTLALELSDGTLVSA